MSEAPKIMSSVNQVFSLSYWLSNNSKYRVVVYYNGKDGGLIIKIYLGEDNKIASQIYKVEKMRVKSEAIILKELNNIIDQLLLIKKDFD